MSVVSFRIGAGKTATESIFPEGNGGKRQDCLTLKVDATKMASE
jgi:hypothetical protein